MDDGRGGPPRDPFEVTVTAADGPRAPVPDPPFHDAAPLVAVTLETLPDGDRAQPPLPFLYLGLDGLPGAAAILRGDRLPGTSLEKALTLFVHSSGNGYVGITVAEHTTPSASSGPGPRALRVAVDPVRYADGLAAAARGGRLVLAHLRTSTEGARHRALLTVDVDAGMLDRIIRAALTHPRRVRVGLRGTRVR
ncbi:hypothetical protein [Streptomyces genisteinicus]|uniref:Uncharacterized protein n=1 Tax=Streptomyces genisteinicus TaxID=2768068 RepID=A0A7H0HY21_9ACTN|nr:hypothetical protein [Streptomyces genisteinicus]QNP65437.1 hypothetical protein IAG43_22580 [Streptomyces genisteinicus]